jgi:hypothetical protein
MLFKQNMIIFPLIWTALVLHLGKAVPNTCVPPAPNDPCESNPPLCPYPECEPCCFCIPNGNGNCPLKDLATLQSNGPDLIQSFLGLHGMWNPSGSDIFPPSRCQPYQDVYDESFDSNDLCEGYSSIHETKYVLLSSNGPPKIALANPSNTKHFETEDRFKDLEAKPSLHMKGIVERAAVRRTLLPI